MHAFVMMATRAKPPRERLPPGRVGALTDGEPLEGLAGNGGDDLEVLVDVQNGKPAQFSSCGDDEVGDRGRPVLTAISEQGQDFDSPVLNSRGLVLDRHRR